MIETPYVKLSATRLLAAHEVDFAVQILASGGLVAVPSETVYGLAGDATNPVAVAAIYDAKGRPAHNPLICHVADVGAASALADFSPMGLLLAEHFWPGPLTLVARVRPDTSIVPALRAGGVTIALRVPQHPVFRAVLAALGRPLAAPSANPSGRLSPTCARHVMDHLGGRIAAVLDGGPCQLGLESTIVDVSGATPRILRAGALYREVLEGLVGAMAVTDRAGAGPLPAPGMLASHYAPRAALRLNALTPQAGEAYLAFGPDAPPGAAANLSANGDLAEAAANFFAILAALDASGPATIAVAPIPDHGLGAALNDRLRRAAAPRL